MRRGVPAAVLALALALGAGGCGAPDALSTSRDVVTRWFEALAGGDVDAARALYPESLASDREDAALRERLAALARRGAPRAREEVGWTVHARVRDEGTGWFVTLTERVSWSACTLTLRFHLYRPFLAGDEARLLGHERVDAEGCEGPGLAV